MSARVTAPAVHPPVAGEAQSSPVAVSSFSLPSLKDPALAIVYRPVASLQASPRNARTHSRQQIRKISDSIRSFGFLSPVLIDRTGAIVAGHGRVQAARLLHLEEVPTIQIETLSPDQLRAYALADNRLALDAGWDQELLKVELLHLCTVPDLDLSLTGFEIPEVDLILGLDPQPTEAPELVPAPSSVAVTQVGDLWQLGDHRLLCGDARDPQSYRVLLGRKKAAAAFLDPPYNVPIHGHASGKGQTRHREFAMAAGEMSQEEFTQFLATTLGHTARCSADGAIHFIAMDWRHLQELLTAGERTYHALLQLCVWAKSSAGMGSFYRNQHEFVFVYRAGKGPHRNNVQLGKFGRDRSNVWHYPSASVQTRKGEEGNLLAFHPTVKSTAMVADALLDCTKKGDLVLDSFLGSGTTLLAAERTRRVCYGLEIDPLYVDLSIRRWQELTGEVAVHALTGRRFEARAEVAHG